MGLSPLTYTHTQTPKFQKQGLSSLSVMHSDIPLYIYSIPLHFVAENAGPKSLYGFNILVMSQTWD